MNKPAYNPEQKNTIASGANPSTAKTGKGINPKTVAGAAAGAAVIGVGGTAAAMHLSENADDAEEQEIDLDAQAEEIELDGNGDFNPDAPISGIGSIFGANAGNTPAADHPAETPSRPNPDSATQAPTAAQQQPAAQQPSQAQEPNTNTAGNSTTTGNTNSTTTENPANTSGQNENGLQEDPDDGPVSVDEVIALTEVDENDADMPELLSFENVELVQDEEDGTVQVQAQFTMEGENYTMIDVDNDGVFDTVADAAGNAQGSAAGMMLSDIELINNENNTDYLAANEYDNNGDVSGSGESAIDDTVTV